MDALLVALVVFLFLPVFIIIGAGIMAFSIANVASVTASSSAVLCERGALRMCNFYDHSFISIQNMQRLLTIVGIAIFTCSESVLQIHLDVTVLRSTLAKECI
jgi:hypothetical protein